MATQAPVRNCHRCGKLISFKVVERDNPLRLMRPIAWEAIPCGCREPARVTLTDGTQVYPEHRAIDPKTGQQQDYVVLAEAERAQGFVRPVRRSYVHLKCGTKTTMAQSIAETYARDPYFYGGTFCCGCRNHFPVGANGEFVWDGTNEKVGT